MRLQQPALPVTFAIAVVAAVFAVWRVVTDAPWEDTAPIIVQPVDRTAEIRCEGALRYRDEAVAAFATQRMSFFTDRIEDAEAEIDRYC